MAITRLASVAGVRIPDTALCNSAVELLEATSPQFLCNHCLRTYVFGSLAVKSVGRAIIDEEISFCGALQILTWTDDVARTAGCTLHDHPIPTASQLMSAAPFDE